MAGRLSGRVAVISGAAGGLGKAAAIRLASEGAAIEILDLKDGGTAVDEIAAAGGQANAILCDCTDEQQIARAANDIESRHGRGLRSFAAIS